MGSGREDCRPRHLRAITGKMMPKASPRALRGLHLDKTPAPALSRALQRLLAHFEGSIMVKLQDYEHLSTPRAQRAELSALESRRPWS